MRVSIPLHISSIEISFWNLEITNNRCNHSHRKMGKELNPGVNNLTNLTRRAASISLSRNHQHYTNEDLIFMTPCNHASQFVKVPQNCSRIMYYQSKEEHLNRFIKSSSTKSSPIFITLDACQLLAYAEEKVNKEEKFLTGMPRILENIWASFN